MYNGLIVAERIEHTSESHHRVPVFAGTYHGLLQYARPSKASIIVPPPLAYLDCIRWSFLLQSGNAPLVCSVVNQSGLHANSPLA
jgi:hypothetical protein